MTQVIDCVSFHLLTSNPLKVHPVPRSIYDHESETLSVMAPKPAAKALSSEEYLEKVSGPKVDIYVGNKRKHYSIPKDLLIHYSGYFARKFEPGCKIEDIEDAIYFPDESPDDFTLLVDYLYRQRRLEEMLEATDALQIARCLNFIEFVGRLEFGEAAEVICPVLESILSKHASNKDPMALIEPDFIRIAFSVVPASREILKLLSQAALPETMKKLGGKYEKELTEVEGFLRETWRQFHMCREEIRFSFPLNPYVKKKL